MLAKVDPTRTRAWQRLKAHHRELRKVHMADLFRRDPRRFSRFSIRFEDLLIDYSKNRITAETLRLLLELAKECRLKETIEKMFAGERINETEGRAVLHVALRNRSNWPICVDGKDVMPEVEAVLGRMESFSERLLTGQWKGYTGRRITDLVNIGIGGADLGPSMVTEALKPYWRKDLRPHFLSNVDGAHVAETLKDLSPETTLFIVSSKSFTTRETLTNAATARRWFLDAAKDENDLKKHFVAVSANQEGPIRFGIPPENLFPVWDWVGGRYSLWSAMGLVIVCSIGFRRFVELLEGAHAMDKHLRETPFAKNIPVILALIGIWYTNFFGAETEAILPYDQSLRQLTAYLQQLGMESNGKSIDRSGHAVKYQTGPILWGGPGTNGQHAFYQLLHQGTRFVPCDFIVAVRSHYSLEDHHLLLISNCFAQTEALLKGKTREEVFKELRASGISAEEMEEIIPHKVFEGNRPTNTLLLRQLNPRTLGSLIALYEHKTFVQGVIWNIFSFDQWGVELGKQLADEILEELKDDAPVNSHDSSTNGLINTFKEMRRLV